jgi:hypothetical protein
MAILLLLLLQQALVHERGNPIQNPIRSIITWSADGLYRFQGAASDEDAKPTEELLILSI